MPIRDGGGEVEFGVKITADGSVFVNGVRAATQAQKDLTDAVKKGGDAAEAAGKSHESLTGAVVKGTGAVEILKRAWDQAVEVYRDVKEHTDAAQQSQARLEAIVRATGGAAGQSVQTVGQLADEMQRLTKFDDTQIKDASATLLTFDKVAGDAFTRVIKLSADLAATGRGDLQTWVTILGKVGQEPVQSLGALERVIGKLDPAMKVMIKNLADAGDKQAALNRILDELEGRVGGTAQQTYSGIARQVGGVTKAWDELVRTMGNEIFNAKSKEAGVFETVLVHMSDTFKSRMQAMKDAFSSLGSFADVVRVLLGLPPELAAASQSANADTPAVWQQKLAALEKMIAQMRATGDPTADLEQSAGYYRGLLTSQNPPLSLMTPPTGSAATPAAKPSANDLLDDQQKRALDNQRLEQEKAFQASVYQVRADAVQRSITLEGYRHDALLEADDVYYGKVAALEQKKLSDELARLQATLKLEKQERGNAGTELTAAVGAEDSARVAAAKARILDIDGQIKVTEEQIVGTTAKWGDAEAKRAAQQYKDDSAMIDRWVQIGRDRQDYQRTLDQTVGDLQQEADLVGKTEEETRQANAQRALALQFDQKRLEITRQLEDLQAKPAKSVDDLETIKDLQAELDKLPEMFGDAATKSRALIAQIFSRKRSTELWGGLVSGMEDAFQAGFGQVGKSWKSAIDAFKSTFERDFLQWLYAQFAKPIFLNVVAGVTGGFGLPGISQAATAAAGGNTLGSAASNVLSSFGSSALSSVGLGGGFAGLSAGFASGASEAALGASFVGPSATLASGTVGLGASAGAAAETSGLITAEGALSATGWGVVIAAAIAIVAAIVSRGGGGPKVGGSAGSSYGPNGQYLGAFTDPLTDNGRLFTPDQMDPQMRQVNDATAMGFYSALAGMGGHSPGMRFEIGEDNDPQGSAKSRVSGRVFDAQGNLIYNNVDQEMDDKEVPAAIALEVEREILAAIQHSDLGDKTLEGIFKSVKPETATKDQIDVVNALAQSYQQLKETIASVDMTPAQKIAAAIATLNKAVTAADEGFTDALGTGDNAKILASEQQLYTAVINRYNAELQMVQQLAAQVRQIEESAYQFSISIAQKINSVGGHADLPGLALGRATQLRTRVEAGQGTLSDRVQDVQSYVGAIDTWYQSRVAAINADAERQAAQLDASYKGMAANAQATADALQKQLDIANAWKDVLDQAKSMIDDMRLSSANPLSAIGRAQMAGTDVHALLDQYNAATGQTRVDLAKQLMDSLKTYQSLGQNAFQRPSDEYTAIYNEVVRDLSQIKGDAQDPAAKSVELQQQILDAQQQANMWGSMTANAADIAKDQLDALNEEALGYYTWAEQNGTLLFEQQHRDAIDQLNAVTGGKDVNLFIAELNKDMLATLKSIDARLAKQYGGSVDTPAPGPGSAPPAAPPPGPGEGSTSNPLGRPSSLVINVVPGEDALAAIQRNATRVKRFLANA